MKYNEIYYDIFNLPKKANWYLGHCIASDFGMGAGIAVDFQKKYHLRDSLKRISYIEDTSPGTCILVKNVFNLITKKKSSGKPTYDTLRSSLEAMKEIIKDESIKRLALPKIGCGLDRLQWTNVLTMLYEVFDEMDIEILICKLYK